MTNEKSSILGYIIFHVIVKHCIRIHFTNDTLVDSYTNAMPLNQNVLSKSCLRKRLIVSFSTTVK